MMLLHLLLHVLIFHLLTAKGGPRDSEKGNEKASKVFTRDLNYVVRYIEQCPDVGYYFRREATPNSFEPGLCYLCFCQGEHKAVCWRRENKRCNTGSFRYRGFGKRDTSISHGSAALDTRVRRSPGFADIFFRDASRDVFNKNTEPEQCKPYESSFSDDCPPADWCTGCTVCDCDANGRWDCHILSFCSDDKKGKNKGRKGSNRKTVKKKPIRKANSKPKTTPKTKTPKTQAIKPSSNKINAMNTKHIFKKPSPVKGKLQKKKPSVRYQKISPKAYTTRSVKFIKKNIATHNPIEIMGNNLEKIVKRHQNNTLFLAQQVVKKVMATVRQMVQKEMLNMTLLATGKKLPLIQNKNKTVKKGPVIPKSKNKSRLKARASGKKVNKRQINVTSKKVSSFPVTWQKRSKRSLISENAPPLTTTSTTMVTPEVKPVEQSVVPVTTTLRPIISNLLVPSQAPVSINKHENEYYKYILATENILNNSFFEHNKINSNFNKARKDKSEKSILQKKESKYVEHNILYNIINKMKGHPLNKSNNPSNIHQVLDINVFNTKASTVRNDGGFNSHLNYLSEVDPEQNDLKFNSWPKYNIIKENAAPISVERSKNILKLLVNNSVDKLNKNKVHGKDIDRIAVSRKYSLVKIRNRNRCPFLDNFFNIVNKTNTETSHKKTGLQDVLVKLLKEYQNNSRKASKKIKKFSVIRYLKKIFISIFKRKNNSERFHRNHVIETLCENFGPCKVEVKDKVLLQSKLRELDNEAMKILKTVRIIKGLLKLLNYTVPNTTKQSHRESFRNDMHRLNSIINDNYKSYFKDSLSMTEVTQIDYIKKNTDDFVRSVSKFATLLNEIVTILTQKTSTPDINHNKVLSIQKRLTKKDQFQTLKSLFLKYNTIQNNFMKKMYEILTSYEKRVNDKPKVSAVRDMNISIAIENYSRNILKNLRKLSHLSQTLNSNSRTKRETRDDTIEYFLMLMEYLLKQNHPLDAAPVNDGIDLLIDAIKNAPDIKTIRKKVLDYTSSPDQETTSYEYYTETTSTVRHSTEITYSKTKPPGSESHTLKNSEKLNTSENDLKMEGIKDIFEIVDDEKDTEEKFQFDRRADVTSDLMVDATTEFMSTTEINVNEAEVYINNKETTTQLPLDQLNYNNEDIIENNKFVSQNKGNVYSLNANPNNTDTNYNEYSFNGKLKKGNNNYNGYIYSDVTQSIYSINNSTENVNFIESDIDNNQYLTSNKGNFNGNRRATKDSVTVVTDSNLHVSRNQNVEKSGARKFQPVYDFEERIVSMLEKETPNNTDSKSTTPSTLSKSIEIKTLDSYDSDSLDKKAKLEWIEENFGREEKINENKSENVIQSTEKTDKAMTNKAEVTWSQKNTPKADVSYISSEGRESNKNIVSKPNNDEVMLKKQMDLLNSLDYGTERGDFDELESKDGERISETFSTYDI